MLSDTKQNLLEQLVSNASFEELIYAKGYLAGYIAKSGEGNSTPQKSSALVNLKPLIVYGTETGNAKKVASKLQAAYRDWETDRKSTRLNSSHITRSRMPSSA